MWHYTIVHCASSTSSVGQLSTTAIVMSAGINLMGSVVGVISRKSINTLSNHPVGSVNGRHIKRSVYLNAISYADRNCCEVGSV